MNLSTNAARQHVAYNVWATRRLLDTIAPLTREQLERDFGTADRSIFGTLLHLLRAESNWLNRVEGRDQIAVLPTVENVAQLSETWSGVHERWTAFITGAKDADLEAACSYHDFRGNAWTNSVWEILFTVVNHGSHHRGQVSGFLRASGIAPPPLDYIAYVRLKNG